jgi:hypothetical protein
MKVLASPANELKNVQKFSTAHLHVGNIFASKVNPKWVHLLYSYTIFLAMKKCRSDVDVGFSSN